MPMVVRDYWGVEHEIGDYCEFETYLEFIIDQLADIPDSVVEKAGFVNRDDMYRYFFEHGDDPDELRRFLIDYYDGREINV